MLDGQSIITIGSIVPIEFYIDSDCVSFKAPELFAQQPFDESIDVFAFGVILYEIFSGELPYSNIHPSLSQASISQKVLSGLRPDQSRIDLITPFNERRTVDAMKYDYFIII